MILVTLLAVVLAAISYVLCFLLNRTTEALGSRLAFAVSIPLAGALA